MIYGMIEKDCSFSLVDPKDLVRTARAVIQTDFSHTAPAFHAMFTTTDCPSVLLHLLLRGKRPGIGLQATAKEGFPLPWAPL